MPRVLSSSTILAALVLTTTTFGCARSPTPAATGHAVRFAIALDARGFAAGALVTVDVWNQAALALRDRQAACHSTTSLYGTTVHCPDGEVAPAPMPERFTFTAAELTRGFTVAALSVRVGEPFELSINGTASDGCNHAMASTHGTVTGLDMKLAVLVLAQTELACRPAA
jgi:hypothetical protein